MKDKEVTSEDSGEEKSETPGDVNEKIGKEHDAMDEQWKKKMEEAVLKLRSSLKEKLVQLGIKPEGDLTISQGNIKRIVWGSQAKGPVVPLAISDLPMPVLWGMEWNSMCQAPRWWWNGKEESTNGKTEQALYFGVLQASAMANAKHEASAERESCAAGLASNPSHVTCAPCSPRARLR